MYIYIITFKLNKCSLALNTVVPAISLKWQNATLTDRPMLHQHGQGFEPTPPEVRDRARRSRDESRHTVQEVPRDHHGNHAGQRWEEILRTEVQVPGRKRGMWDEVGFCVEEMLFRDVMFWNSQRCCCSLYLFIYLFIYLWNTISPKPTCAHLDILTQSCWLEFHILFALWLEVTSNSRHFHLNRNHH